MKNTLIGPIFTRVVKKRGRKLPLRDAKFFNYRRLEDPADSGTKS